MKLKIYDPNGWTPNKPVFIEIIDFTKVEEGIGLGQSIYLDLKEGTGKDEAEQLAVLLQKLVVNIHSSDSERNIFARK